jgi:hypothetical protein
MESQITKKTIKPFTKQWWIKFLKSTNNLKSPKIFKNQLSKTDIDQLNNCIKNVIIYISENNLSKAFRVVSINGDVNFENNQYLCKNPPLPNEDLPDWCERIFANKKFGVILNRCQYYDRNLKQLISRKFLPLLKLDGVPPHGIEISFFFGNYGFTPLGFHVDPLGHKVTHLHLGPGKKEMHLINKDNYENKLKEKTGSKNFDAIIPNCKSYYFQAGDIFFMPNNLYHVGNSQELSFSLTVWHIEPSLTEFQSRVSMELMQRISNSGKNLLNKIFADNNDNINLTKDINSAFNIDSWAKQLKDYTGIPEEYKNLTLEETFNLILKEIRLRLFSNGYFYSYSNYNEAPVEMILLNKTSILKGIKPYIIIPLKINESLYLFIQGQKVKVPNHEEILTIIDIINSYEEVTLGKLFSNLSLNMNKTSLNKLINNLYQHGAFQIT